jgi:signal recognition particle receptor subunit beta
LISVAMQFVQNIQSFLLTLRNKAAMKSGCIHKNVIVIGLDAAGKTSFANKLNNLLNLWGLPDSTVKTVIPTIGFNIETLKIGDFIFHFWDIGGADKIWPFWIGYIEALDSFSALVFIVDSHDRERIDANLRPQLDRFLDPDAALKIQAPNARMSAAFDFERFLRVPLLVLANKQDLAGSCTPHELVKILALENIRDRSWVVLPTALIHDKEVRVCWSLLKSMVIDVDWKMPATAISSTDYFAQVL